VARGGASDFYIPTYIHTSRYLGNYISTPKSLGQLALEQQVRSKNKVETLARIQSFRSLRASYYCDRCDALIIQPGRQSPPSQQNRRKLGNHQLTTSSHIPHNRHVRSCHFFHASGPGRGHVFEMCHDAVQVPTRPCLGQLPQ
jgi:hypothetical protein